MIRSYRYSYFFPYAKFRNEQEGVISDLEKDMRSGKNALFVAPNGTGKTVIALSSTLPVVKEKDLKLVYLTRTHAQSSRVIRELALVNSVVDGKDVVNGVSIKGITEMCLNRDLLKQKVKGREAVAMYAELRKAKNCKLYTAVKTAKTSLRSEHGGLSSAPPTPTR